MIVLDLEWNRGYDKTALDEILQIGAVRLCDLSGTVTDTFSVHIRPKVHKKISAHSKLLPELQSALDSNIDFPAAYTAFRDWCGEDRYFAQWGSDDLTILGKNCEHWGLPPLVPEKSFDFQWAFSAALNQSHQIRLCDAVEYLGIPTPFCFHNALNDALYTAMVGSQLGEKRAFAEKPPHEKKRRSRWNFTLTEFSPQPKRRIGPFNSKVAVLNAKNSRRPLCPVCREKCLVRMWYFSDPLVYYAPFRCPEHGDFLCRMTLSSSEQTSWTGRLAVPLPTPEVLAVFDTAFHSGSHLCRSAGKKRKKRRWFAQPAKS